MNYKALYFICFLIFLIFIASVVSYHFFVQIPQDKKDAENQKLMDAALAEIDAENAKQAEIDNKKDIQQKGVSNCLDLAYNDYLSEWYSMCEANLKDSRITIKKDEDGNVDCSMPIDWSESIKSKYEEKQNYCKTKEWQEWDYEVGLNPLTIRDEQNRLIEYKNQLTK